MIDDVLADAFAAIDAAPARAVKWVARFVLTALKAATPVKTGNLKASWVIGIGGPIQGEVSSPTAVDTSVQESGLAELAEYTLDQGEVYLTNNAPYAEHVAEADRFNPPIEQAVEAGVGRALDKLEGYDAAG